jgi:hypothetical protein
MARLDPFLLYLDTNLQEVTWSPSYNYKDCYTKNKPN